IGVWPFVLIFGLTSFLGAALGIWLFYIHHQFEEAHWDQPEDWNVHEAALNGCSHYDLPKPLRWLTGNIGVHHVHHLYSRIPFYRLTEVLRDHPVLGDVKRLTLWQSFGCINLRLWDEGQRRMVRFAEVRV
ncbi:MAG: fatty acid desaturase, partial [Rhodobacteraceae bacterium]|nr:fatty acid desaturase [Paracoccaceae bacterium]